ncbi:UPF0149 family protein, partial [Mesorhizobium sp. M0254]|uniref:UPF0149 family protein n=1 Tax=Mesorhizobium sp. M0254 TaxID=2956927 RepID=UPI0033397358
PRTQSGQRATTLLAFQIDAQNRHSSRTTLSDEALEAWMASKTDPRPLVRTMSALDGFVTAAVTGPRFADPQDWMCPLMGLPRDVLAKGSATDHAVFASVARIHNRINEMLLD